MKYEAKDFSSLFGVEGLSRKLLETHFTLYQGYVANTNKIQALLAEAEAGSPPYGELKRRFGWEFDGMRLHEYYFGNMKKGAAPLDKASDIGKEIASQFGSIDRWEKDFRATGGIRGIGWAALALDREHRRLFNVWVNEHDAGHLAGQTLLLIMDVFEHAYLLDYGTQRADYIDSFMKSIDWSVASKRFRELPVNG